MSIEQFLSANNAKTTIAIALGPSDTTINLAVGTGGQFPSPTAPQYFVATLSSPGGLVEIVKATALSGDIVTVVRAQEGTAAQAWPVGTAFQHLWTRGQAQALVQWTMLDPIVSLNLGGGGGAQTINLSDYAYAPDRVLVKLTASAPCTIGNITGLLTSATLVTLYVAEGSSNISIPLNTPPFHLSNTAAPAGFPGYPRSSISMLYMPENAAYKWIETGRSWRTS
jgi:hypothetical protein